MKIGLVTGTVVSTVKQDGLKGLKLLIVQEAGTDGKPLGKNFLVAADAVGAGLGDLVITTAGSSARLTEFTNERPVDAVIVGIVDFIELEGTYSYRKYSIPEK